MKSYFTQDHNRPSWAPVQIPCGGLKIGLLAGGQGWMGVEKPSGLSIHNDPGADLRSLLDHYIQADRKLSDLIAYGASGGLNAVNRLDRQTSGVVLLATCADVFRHIAAQFESRSVQKRYVAVLHGILTAGRNPSGWQNWQWSLSDRAGGRRNPKGRGRLRQSLTRVRIEAHSTHFTLVECEPATGRKHQIRRHAKLAGHAIVGDRRYGTLRSVQFLKEKLGFQRLALHCQSLQFQPPGNAGSITVQTEQIPAAMDQLFDRDKIGYT